MFMIASYFDFALGVVKAVGPFILLAAIVYGFIQWRKRSKALDDIGERQARKLYTDERAQRDNLPGEESGGPPARPT
jgi:hypothetical protein